MTTPRNKNKANQAGSVAAGAGSAPAMPKAPKVSLRTRWQDVMGRPYTDYTMILITVGMLTGIGVAMVASSSMTWSILEGAGVWSNATRQGLMVVLGLVTMWLMMRVSPVFIRRLSPWIIALSILLLIMVLTPLGTGREEVGSQSWLMLGPLTFQPSEFARLAIAIWGAAYLSGAQNDPLVRKRRLVGFTLMAVLMAGLIMAEQDLGMVLAFMVVVLALYFFAGINLRIIFGPILVIAVLLVIHSLQRGGFRGERFRTFGDSFFGNFSDTRGSAYQSYQGFLSLADGGLTGVGLGQSRAKWFYLPEARNDFIFAIIGEELGLLGASVVIVLFCTLGYFGFQTVKRVQNQYLALLAGALTASVVVQAFINMGYVLGLLPVTGIQLPLISAGGTSAVITLAAMGILVNCARHEPATISAMQNKGRPKFDLLLRLQEPSIEGIGTAEAPVKKTAAPKKDQSMDRRPKQRHLTQDTAADPRGYPAQRKQTGTNRRRNPHAGKDETTRRGRDQDYGSTGGTSGGLYYGQSRREESFGRDTKPSRESGNERGQENQPPQLRRRRPPSNRWR
ncbi:MAG: putative peptidoglycan glycosyltransferase FtsW [Corynebacterium sp.]|nr:putative peptidoglycan glycosyltransferase FtsW [Corynebacterium sp.]